ncbi:hypothetical protein BDZ91DRAFT_781490 [Kalaharituber pfeilii]|nr:hypothetical protein BDZ91DRAFT_781490 [Kalaharituber pfeilii]
MDDLAGLSFDSTSSSNPPSKPQNQKLPTTFGTTNSSTTTYSSLSALRASSTTPQSRGTSPANVAHAPKPATDSFANLLTFGSKSSQSNGANLSLQERQRMLEQQKAKEAEEKRKQLEAQFGGGQFWDKLEKSGGSSGGAAGSGSLGASSSGGTRGGLASFGINPPAPAQQKPQVAVQKDGDDEDLFAAFSASAPVDKTSHFPPPASNPASTITTPRFGTPNPPLQQQKSIRLSEVDPLDPFDDPFDLGKLPTRTPSNHPPAAPNNDDSDDILGLLAKPVSELPPPQPPRPAESPAQEKRPTPTPTPPVGGDPRDGAIAELMDMGFSLAQARKALAETDTGLDVQQAVSWLLNEAHRQSKASAESRTRSTSGSRRDKGRDMDRDRSREPPEGDRRRQMYREEERRAVSGSSSRRRDGSEQRQPAWAGGGGSGEKDIAAIASEVGSNLFKSANSLWNQGKKKMEKAVRELQQDKGKDGDDGMPKWMREAQQYQQQRELPERRAPDSRGRKGGEERDGAMHEEPNLTYEAQLLEAEPPGPQRKATGRSAQRASPQRASPQPPTARNQNVSPAPSHAHMSPAELQRKREMEFADAVRKKEMELREREAAAASSRRAKLTREAVKEETVAYVSPARRRKAEVPKAAAPAAPPVPTEDLLFGDGTTKAAEPSRSPLNQQRQQQRPTPPPQMTSTPIQVRKAAPPRPTILISPRALTSSTTARQAGTAAFKLGDYTSALGHYTKALSPVPEKHPLLILLLCNRALCHLKVGDPKSCIADCDDALELIGEGRGEREEIDLGGEEGKKEMREFWEKATARKAEALEQMEKWDDAGKCWAVLVEAGRGGSNAIAGRRRCEAAVAPKPKPAARPAPPPKAASAPPSQTVRRPPPPPSQQSQEAVTRLREANAGAEALEREKLALYDSVNDRINAWKKGKEGNLRALLTSLDGILWEGSGWKKVGMHELVLAGKVKVWYMKGIARVHPDKIPVDATTEQRMISGAVFSLLNEAWDKFKADNNL